jgi:hypothetical protein
MEMQSAEIKDLASALSKAQKVMRAIPKDSVNPFFKSKYADMATVVEHTRAALADNGLAVTQGLSLDAAPCLITTLIHSSGQWLRSAWPITPVKNDPQGIGSAVTYARRYAYCAIIGVASGDEDDDGNAATQAPRSESKPAPKAEKPKSDKPAETPKVDFDTTEFICGPAPDSTPENKKFVRKKLKDMTENELQFAHDHTHRALKTAKGDMKVALEKLAGWINEVAIANKWELTPF